jgi:hypothetical protein
MQTMIEIGYYVKPIMIALMLLGSLASLPVLISIDKD